MSFISTLSFAASLCLLIALCANLIIQVENKSFFGIGTRAIGDQLLLKDVLQTPPVSLTESPVIKFKYAIVEPITYLGIESDQNVHAEVNFSYELNLIEGTISSINSQHDRGTSKPETIFKVLIRIYGFNETMLDINPAYIFNKDQQFNGLLKPIYQQESLSITKKDLKALDDLDDLDLEYDDDAINDDDDDDTGDKKDIDSEDNEFNNEFDKVIEQGKRQEGDSLVYEINQTSATKTQTPTSHSVTFYYVDIYYITYVKFTIYEYYLDHPLNIDDNSNVVEYAQISPTTLKAVVTDHRTTSLFVHMQMYGFHPFALPSYYKPFLSNSQTPATARPISSMTQLQILMKQQHETILKLEEQLLKQRQHSNSSVDWEEVQRINIKQISTDDKSKVNCMQQVLPSSPNSSQRIFVHWSIFNLIVTIFLTKMIFI